MSFDSLLARLHPDAKKRGDEFERICAWYLRNAPEYRRRFRKVWLWTEWPGAEDPDAGIDLVAEEHDGDLWAIQAKAYDPSYTITKRDVDTFLAEAGRFDFSYRLVIATTDRLGARAKRTLDDQRVPAGYRLRSQLELAQVEWPASPDALRPPRPARKKPFPHIKEAIRETVKGLKGTDRGQLIMACGTGKTLAAMWIAERLDAKRTLILLPSLSLLAQTLREWSANASKPFEYLAVCSDETVAGQDEFVQQTAELGLPVTTDPELIAAFLRRRGRRVVFATYQSSPQIAAAYSGRTPRIDLAVADEAHRCAGRTSTGFATILDSNQIKAKRRLFMTATPRVYTERVRRVAGLFDVELATMDDEEVFGPVLHRLGFGEAIERDLLSDYQVVVVGVTDPMYRRWAERGKYVRRDGEPTDARTLAGQIGLAKTMRKYDLHRVISFHGRVKAAREFSAEIPDVIRWMPPGARPAGGLWSEHVSGRMTSGRRDRLLLRFRNLAPKERGLLSNARCLGEGVDVPSIDGVAFIDPRRSTIDIIQALGRAIRKAPDKKLGTIVIPVFVDKDTDPEEALDTSAFRHVWDVVKALRAHDERLSNGLDHSRRERGRQRAPSGRPDTIKLDVPVGVEFARAFDVRLVEQTTASWEFWFGLLQRYVTREEHARVPVHWREDGYALGNWANNQRAFFARGELEDTRRDRLEGLRGWVWNTLEAAWEEGFAHLERFAEREGHARVPVAFREEHFKLGRWVVAQRAAQNRGKLDPARRDALEALPGWTWDAREAWWDEGYARLRQFVGRTGHSRVPQKHQDDDGYRLGAWVAVQREFHQQGDLSRERARRLEALPGWVWETHETAWRRAYARLSEFAEREGHSRVPGRYRTADGFNLGSWVNTQRTSRGRGTLSHERVRHLEALPRWTWNSDEFDWNDRLSRLCRFAERQGHVRLPQRYVDGEGYRLGLWVSRQREAHKRGALSEQRVQQLEALPGWGWDARAVHWEDCYSRLERFVEHEGHARAPRSYQDEDGVRLGAWVVRQRRARKHGKLSKERAQRLEALPGWVWDAGKGPRQRAPGRRRRSKSAP